MRPLQRKTLDPGMRPIQRQKHERETRIPGEAKPVPQMPEMAPQSGNVQIRREMRSMRQRATPHNDPWSNKTRIMGEKRDRGRNKQRMTSQGGSDGRGTKNKKDDSANKGDSRG